MGRAAGPALARNWLALSEATEPMEARAHTQHASGPHAPEHTELIHRWRRTRALDRLGGAATRGRNLGPAIVSLATSCVLFATGPTPGAVVVLAVGLMYYAAAVGTAALAWEQPRPPRLRARDLPHAVLGGVLPEDIRCESLRIRYVSVVSRYERLLRLAADADRELTAAVQGSVAECGALVAEAGTLALGTNSIEDYLAEAAAVPTAEREDELTEQAAHCDDLQASSNYLQAAELTERHRHIHRDLLATLDRADARLAAIECMLDLLAARLVRLQTRALLGAPEADVVARSSIEGADDDLALIEASFDDLC